MTTKKDAVPGMEQKGKTVPMNKVNNDFPVVAQEAKKPTVEELQKTIEILQKQLSIIPSDLTSRIEYFNHKKALILKLARMDADRENLTSHLDKLSEIAAANEFENEDYYLNIEGPSGTYSKKALYTVKNPVIIGELISFVIGRLDSRREQIKKEIEA